MWCGSNDGVVDSNTHIRKRRTKMMKRTRMKRRKGTRRRRMTRRARVDMTTRTRMMRTMIMMRRTKLRITIRMTSGRGVVTLTSFSNNFRTSGKFLVAPKYWYPSNGEGGRHG